MVATSGSDLIASDAVRTLCRELFPLSALITPNRHEAEVLAEMPIHSRDDMVRAAQTIAGRYGCNVLLKGGHSDTDADDLLALRDGQLLWFPPCPAPSRQTSPRASGWRTPSPGPRPI